MSKELSQPFTKWGAGALPKLPYGKINHGKNIGSKNLILLANKIRSQGEIDRKIFWQKVPGFFIMPVCLSHTLCLS